MAHLGICFMGLITFPNITLVTRKNVKQWAKEKYD